MRRDAIPFVHRAECARRADGGAPTATGLGPLLVAVCVAACGAEPGAGNGMAWIGEIGPETFEGKVRQVGNAPFVRTIVEAEDEGAVTVTGPYRAEVGRLANAIVRVTGHHVEGELPGRTMEATSYEILSIDGDHPLVGTLMRDGDGFYLEMPRRGRKRVEAVQEPLARRAGALIWVVLDENDGVARYGVLRAAPPAGGAPDGPGR